MLGPEIPGRIKRMAVATFQAINAAWSRSGENDSNPSQTQSLLGRDDATHFFLDGLGELTCVSAFIADGGAHECAQRGYAAGSAPSEQATHSSTDGGEDGCVFRTTPRTSEA